MEKQNHVKEERQVQRNYWKLVKNWIGESGMDENMKLYIYYYLLHDLKSKKKMRVYADTYKDNMAEIPIFIDVETPAIYSQKTGEYIGYFKNGEKIIIKFD